MSLREQIAEQCYWDYTGQDSKRHPLSLVGACENIQQEMFNRADRILRLFTEWGDGECDKLGDHIPYDPHAKWWRRKTCEDCWQSLRVEQLSKEEGKCSAPSVNTH